MAKKKRDNPKPKEEKALQKWNMQESQRAILVQAQQRHQEELRPLQQYQQNQFMSFLKKIKIELGIPNEVDVTFNPQDMSFTEVPPQPKESNITKDLSKVPA